MLNRIPEKLIGDGLGLATQVELDAQKADTTTIKGAQGKSIENYPLLVPEVNDTGRIQRAFNALVDGDVLIFPYGKTYIITTKITCPIVKNVTIIGYGATINASGVATGSTLIEFIGGVSSDVSITSDVAFGSATVNVSSAAGIVAGDLLFIRDDTLFQPPSTLFKRGELQLVASVAGNQITLETGALDNYTAASNARIAKLTPFENLAIKGLTLKGGGTGSLHQGIFCLYHKNLLIEDCKITNSEQTAISISVSLGCLINKNFIDGSNDIVTPTGYGVVVSTATRDYSITNNVMHKCRHAFTTGGTSVVRFGSVIGNHAWNCVAAAFDTHPATDFIVFNGNTAFMCDSGGFQSRGHHTTISNNLIIMSSAGANCIQSGEEGGYHLTVTGNQIYGGSKGVVLTSGKASYVTIANNTIENCTYGVYIESTITGIEEVKIHHNTIKRSGTNAIRVRGQSNISIKDNTIVDSSLNNPNTTNAVWIESVSGVGGDNIKVIGNTIYDTGGSPTTLIGISVDANYTNVILDENFFKNVTNRIAMNSTSATNRTQLDRNSGTATLLSGTTTVIITHGLIKKPTAIGLTPAGDVGNWWVLDTDITFTTFKVTVKTAPGSDTKLYWNASAPVV